MTGVEFLSFQGLWLVIAGFILGFAASTLWEWLYYRSKRQTQSGQAPPVLPPVVRADHRPSDMNEALDEQATTAWPFSYRSSGVYLESEQPTTTYGEVPQGHQPTKDFVEPPTVHPMASPDQPEPNPPRIDSTPLVALPTTVIQSPVVQPAAQPPVHLLSMPSPTPNPLQPALNPAPTVTPALATAASSNGAESPRRSGVTVVDLNTPRPLSAPPVTASLPSQPVARQAMSTAESITDHPDNLAMIKGVGEAYKRRLYGVGIYTWRQVAESDVENLRRITRAKPNANINGWREQARELAEKYQRWHTTFRGPLDDFTRIDGIGAITADLLYKAGICTYEQLAGALPDELAKIVPAPTVGDEIDFEGWINAAVQFASVKHKNEGRLS